MNKEKEIALAIADHIINDKSAEVEYNRTGISYVTTQFKGMNIVVAFFSDFSPCRLIIDGENMFKSENTKIITDAAISRCKSRSDEKLCSMYKLITGGR